VSILYAGLDAITNLGTFFDVENESVAMPRLFVQILVTLLNARDISDGSLERSRGIGSETWPYHVSTPEVLVILLTASRNAANLLVLFCLFG
jgi:hypothetical protein